MLLGDQAAADRRAVGSNFWPTGLLPQGGRPVFPGQPGAHDVSYCRRLDQPLSVRIGDQALFDPQTDEVAGVKELTQWYSEQLERMIRRAPGQYWWLHRRWKSRPAATTAANRRDPASAGPATPIPPRLGRPRKTDAAMSEYICIARCSDCPPGEGREVRRRADD